MSDVATPFLPPLRIFRLVTLIFTFVGASRVNPNRPDARSKPLGAPRIWEDTFNLIASAGWIR